MNTNKLVAAILTGITAGFVIGVLVAPEKGTELRRKISDLAGDWAEKLIDVFSAGSQQLVQNLDNAVETQELPG